MEGARVAGDIVGRAMAAYDAGCDMLLVCNRPDLAAELLDRWAPVLDPANLRRLERALPSSVRAPWLADPFALELHGPYLKAREQVVAVDVGDDAGPSMTAAQIGMQRTELLNGHG